MSRVEELRHNLRAVRDRVEASCRDAGREAEEVALVVVTKFFPASDVRILADLGVQDVAENRHQEAQAKAAECADLDLRWHFVGGLQSNKAAAVTTYADVVESVDRRKLVAPLARGAQANDRVLDVLLQVSLDPPGRDHRSGVDPDQLLDLAAAVEESEHLHLRGLMAVAPLPEEEEAASAFARLAGYAERLRTLSPDATSLSAGMTHDYVEAIAGGATHLRIGSAITGNRPEPR